ncbi:hypothetical protein IQ241_14215 [Romeria aff. gracilis LEGE 07310]|uniref:Sulfotransferase domain-containing protein n=1 Tax=Vasconcelosia minhoensis LEGE 07310 TaxID=915328 RepID=A0A8J7AQB4_9CYAN|nr:hypothetical protein [Romeria gracilis]MBE9078436.1 hypothetical protein [Romeria aff. gracilis LEGE 07310]
MKTVYLHIGTFKTGTTALQKILFANRQKLLENGYFYPDIGIPNKYNPGQIALSWSFTHDKDFYVLPYKTFDLRDIRERALADIEAHDADNIIISSEYFSLFSTEQVAQVKQMFDGFKVVIILYLRRQDKFFLSLYSEQVKKGYAKDIKDFCEEFEERGNYYKILKSWSTVFGDENLVIKIYPESRPRDWLISDFLQTLNISLEPSQLTHGKKAFNVSLSGKSLKIMRFLNRWLLERFSLPKAWCLWLYLHPLQRQRPKTVVSWIPEWLLSNEILAPDDKDALLRQYKPLNRKVSEEYLDQESHPFIWSQVEKQN